MPTCLPCRTCCRPAGRAARAADPKAKARAAARSAASASASSTRRPKKSNWSWCNCSAQLTSGSVGIASSDCSATPPPAAGGSATLGKVFSLNTNGTGFTPLYSFGFPPDGSNPKAGLILNGATLYGTAQTGGTNNCGAIFSISTNGTGYAILHRFTNAPDGYSPQGEMVLSGSTLFGTTAFGGSSNRGVIF